VTNVGGVAAGGGPVASTPGSSGTSASGTATSGAGAAGAGGGGASGGTVPVAGASTGTGPTTQNVPATGPIEIGFVSTATSNASAFGASLGNTLSDKAIMAALVAAYNGHGGVDGHHVNVVYADTDTGSASWSADFAAACATFTQDHHVQAVLGYVFGQVDALESCLAAKNIPHLSTTFSVPDDRTMAPYPLLVELATPEIQNRSIAKIDAGLAAGFLTPANKLGIVTDECPGTQSAWTNTTEPYIKAKGLHIASTFTIGCPDGSAEAASAASQGGSLVLQFRSAGVDRVLMMATSEGPAVFLFSNIAESQNYHPIYIVSSLGNTAILGSQIPKDQAANVVGVGWLPSQDVAPANYPPLVAAATRCLTMLKSQGVVPTAPADYANAFSSCDAMFLYETALRNDGNQTYGPALVSAIDHLGDSYLSPETYQGRTVYSTSRRDAPSLGRVFGWTASCSCFTYRSQTIPIS
jgi:ABC-type branched-subunit amino acid transport system substrate-binding protein